MPPTTTNSFKAWLKQSTNMKLSSDAAVTRILYEGVTDFPSLLDFDRESIEALSKACSKTIPAITADIPNHVAAEVEIPGANISSISIGRLIVAMNATKYYSAVQRATTVANMHYGNVLTGFKMDFDAYILLRKQEDPEVPLVNDKDKDKKIIKWMPLFEDALSRTFGSKGPLIYVLRDTVAVPSEVDDPLDVNAHYGRSGSMLEELIQRLPHTGPIYRDDNKTVYLLISRAVAGTSVESTIKSFSRQKDGRGAYLALAANHAGDTKYRGIVKSRMNLLQNIKWNGRSYPLEQHVSNHRTAVDDLQDCSLHINNAVPNMAQRVEYLLESISCQDNSLQAAMGNVRADTNNMRGDFEAAASHLIEVDPYRRASRQNNNKTVANVSGVSFAGRGTTGVDLRWHPRAEFLALSDEQKDELTAWQNTTDGKKAVKKQRSELRKPKKRKNERGDNERNGGSWKKKFKKALKSSGGLAHIMSTLKEAETSNASLIAALQPSLPPAPAPAPPARPTAPAAPAASAAGLVGSLAQSFPALSTKVKINSIMKNGNSSRDE